MVAEINFIETTKDGHMILEVNLKETSIFTHPENGDALHTIEGTFGEDPYIQDMGMWSYDPYTERLALPVDMPMRLIQRIIAVLFDDGGFDIETFRTHPFFRDNLEEWFTCRKCGHKYLREDLCDECYDKELGEYLDRMAEDSHTPLSMDKVANR